MFNIIKAYYYTLQELKELNETRESIVRSAHIGNFDKTTLFIAQQKFPVFLGEHLKGFSGEHYRPAFIRRNGGYKKLTKNTQELVMHVNNFLTSPISDKLRQLLSVKENDRLFPAILHWKSLRKLFDQVELQSFFFLKQFDFITDIITVLARYFPDTFNIYATKEGKELMLDLAASDTERLVYKNKKDVVSIFKSSVAENAISYLKNIGSIIQGNNTHLEGIIMHTSVIILLYAVTEVFNDRLGVQRFNQESIDIIHLAGLKMLFFLVEDPEQSRFYSEQFNRMYAKLLEYFPNKLPCVINFHLVPTYTLTEYITTHVDIAEQLNKGIHFFLKNDFRQAKEHFGLLKKSGSLDDNSISQYDLIEDQLDLYFPQQAYYLTQDKLYEISQFIATEESRPHS